MDTDRNPGVWEFASSDAISVAFNEDKVMAGIAATLAAASVVGLTQASLTGSGTRQFHNDYYYRSYDFAYEPICVVRIVKTQDAFGNPVTRRVKVCR